jgi:hypothetical protein
MANILCVLYADPVDGYPPSYPRNDVPSTERYHDGQSTPTPEAIDFTPGTPWSSLPTRTDPTPSSSSGSPRPTSSSHSRSGRPT